MVDPRCHCASNGPAAPIELLDFEQDQVIELCGLLAPTAGILTDKEKKAYKARQRYFAGLKKILQKNKIQKLHLIACDIGKDETFVTRVAKELGVTIVAYKYFTLIKEGTWFLGLSSDHATDNVHKAASVEVPPEEHATVK